MRVRGCCIDQPDRRGVPGALHRTRQIRLSSRRSARSGNQSRASRDRIAPRTRLELHRPGQIRGCKTRIRRQRTRLPGAFVNPTLFSGVNNRMTIAQEEIFGPVAAAIEINGIERVSQSRTIRSMGSPPRSGRGISTWRTRPCATWRPGVIWVNCFDHGDMTQPFGGYKQSGQGRDKCVESLLSYTQTKSAWINLG